MVLKETSISEDRKLKVLIRNCLIASLLWHLIAAWFSTGYHNMDEHFQILEFAAFKMNMTPAATLPWEFAARIRPAFQPAIVVFLQKYWLPGIGPGMASFILRLFSAMLGFGALFFMLRISLKMIEGYEAKRFLVLISTLLWFVPYIHAHFSAESISGSLFFLGLGSIFLAHQNKINNLLTLGGFLIGFAFVCRVQTGFMILGLGIWCIFVARMKLSKLFLIGMPLFMTFIIGLLIDRWFYGEWVFTTWNYFTVNLIQGKAAQYGVSPWYTYFVWGFWNLLPPFSLLVIGGLIYSLIRYRANIFSLTVIPYLLAHIIISHKEPRFLFPMAAAVPLLVSYGYKDYYFRLFKSPRLRKVLLNIFFGANIALMAFSSFKPASDRIGLFEYIYVHYHDKKATLICQEASPYDFNNVHDRYHQPSDMVICKIKGYQGLDSAMQSGIHRPLIILFARQEEANMFATTHPNARLVYSNIPPWVQRFNYNNWMSRTKLNILYEIE